MVKDREAWRATVHGITKSQTRLSDWTTAIITSDSGHLFLLTIYVFFRKMSIQDFSPYFVCFLVLSCMHFLYTLDINLWSVISLANISSQLVGCLFILLMVSFAMQKLLSLIRPHLFNFAFICFLFRDWSKKILLWSLSKRDPPRFSSRSFMVSVLTTRSLETILSLFLGMVWGYVLTSLITGGCPASLTPLAEETVFSLLYILASLLKD